LPPRTAETAVLGLRAEGVAFSRNGDPVRVSHPPEKKFENFRCKLLFSGTLSVRKSTHVNVQNNTHFDSRLYHVHRVSAGMTLETAQLGVQARITTGRGTEGPENGTYRQKRDACQPCQRCLQHLFTVKPRPPGAMHFRQRGTILFFQTSDMNLINATLLLLHFLIMSNISCVCGLCVCLFFMILLSVLVFYVHSFVNMRACHVYFLVNLSLLTY